MAGDRCTGLCCREMPLPYGDTPEQVVRHLTGFVRAAGGRPVMGLDGNQIADMIVFERKVAKGELMPDGTIATADINLFGCRHYDKATNNCGIYETRPTMCSQFPYGHACHYGDACEWDRGRAGTWPIPKAYFSRWDLPEAARVQLEALAGDDVEEACYPKPRRVYLKIVDDAEGHLHRGSGAAFAGEDQVEKPPEATA